MKLLITLFISFILLIPNIFSAENEKEIQAVMQLVTVYPDNAQILSYAEVSLMTGTNNLVIKNLSEFIDNQSIQVKAPAGIKIMSVSCQVDYFSIAKKNNEIESLYAKVRNLKLKIEDENTRTDILKEKLDFLHENKDAGSATQPVSIDAFKARTEYYAQNIEKIKLDLLDSERKIRDFQTELARTENQISSLSGTDDNKTSQIHITVSCKTEQKGKIEISYLVHNAGWKPTYDLRVNSIDKPVALTIQASVYQNTGVDWKNVKLKFSNADLNKSGVAPSLNAYYLNFGRPVAANYSTQNNNYVTPGISLQNGMVKGIVRAADTGEPLPGVYVVVKGTNTGTATDVDGQFNIASDQPKVTLTFSFVGYVSEEVEATPASLVNVQLAPDVQGLQEVIVTGYGVQKKNTITGSISTVKFDDYSGSSSDLTGTVSGIQMRGYATKYINIKRDIPPQLPPLDIKTIVEYEVDEQYTIPSNGKEITIGLKDLEIPAEFEYHVVPKLDKAAFLVARLTDWYKLNLLNGDINLYFENSFIGKSYLDMQSFSDTLDISLGQDNNILVSREKQKSFTSRQVMGNNKTEARSFEISLRNNKLQPVHLIVYDQIPVSTLKDIEVKPLEVSGASVTKDTGELKWTLDLTPAETKKFQVKYEVKYPKYQTLVLE